MMSSTKFPMVICNVPLYCSLRRTSSDVVQVSLNVEFSDFVVFIPHESPASAVPYRYRMRRIRFLGGKANYFVGRM